MAHLGRYFSMSISRHRETEVRGGGRTPRVRAIPELLTARSVALFQGEFPGTPAAFI